MKYWPLIWSGIWRKPGRTLLMLLQILVAFLLFGALQGVKSGVDQAVAATQAQLYWVFPADLGTKLPLGLEQRIAAVPGVKHIYPEAGFGATYQRPSQQVGVLATDFDAGWAGNLDVHASPRQSLPWRAPVPVPSSARRSRIPTTGRWVIRFRCYRTRRKRMAARLGPSRTSAHSAHRTTVRWTTT